jgi:hypothetical protein
MSDAPKSAPRRLAKLQYLGIGLGIGLAFAIASLPNWRIALGWVEFGVIFGLLTPIVQAHRSNRRSPAQTAG